MAPGFREQQVEGMDVVEFAVRDVDEARDVAPEIEQGVHFHRRLGRPEMRPRKDRQAEINGRRVERVDGVGQFQPKVVAGIKPSGLGNQPLSKLRVDPPVAAFVGIGQCRSPDGFPETHRVQLRGLGREADLDVAKALPIGKLGEGHGSILLGAGQCPCPTLPAVPRHDPREGAPRQKIHQLGEKRPALVHWRLPGNLPESARSSSNRHHP